jgi:D-alanyl-D-alanine carboxypeptidase (penicillin-binding protein 5/6)
MTVGAGSALVGHARRDALGVELYVAMLGAPSSDARALHAKRLLDYGFSQYASADLVAPGAVFGRVPVDERPGREVPYRAARPLVAPIRLGQPVTETISAPTQVSGPVAEGEPIGTLTLRQGDHVLGRRELVAAESAGGPGIWDRLRSGLGALLP